MNIVLSIPSGQRTEMLIDVILEWRKVCDFKIALYTWDERTEKEASGLVEYFRRGGLASFAVNQNFLAKSIEGWEVFICGADDLYPGHNIDKIESVCRRNPDKVIWVKDGFLNQQPTHSIITRGWYDRHGYIFDEGFKHNFCDSDLLMRTMKAGEIVRCFDISFDHRHYLKDKRTKDDIYRLGESTYSEDERYFYSKYERGRISLKGVPEVHV